MRLFDLVIAILFNPTVELASSLDRAARGGGDLGSRSCDLGGVLAADILENSSVFRKIGFYILYNLFKEVNLSGDAQWLKMIPKGIINPEKS